MRHLKGFNVNENSFFEENPKIEDVLSPLIDLDKEPLISKNWRDDRWVRDTRPNFLEVTELFEIRFKFKNDPDYNIELLQTFKSVRKRIEVYSERLGFDFTFNVEYGVTIYLSRTVPNPEYVSYGDEFRKLIDIDKHYWVIRNGNKKDVSFNKFFISDDSSDYISHGRRGDFFDLREFRSSVGNLKGQLGRQFRIILPEGEESKVYKDIFGSDPKDEREMLSRLRQNLLSRYNSFSEKTDIMKRMKMFDDAMSVIYPKYKSYDLSKDDKNFKFRIG